MKKLLFPFVLSLVFISCHNNTGTKSEKKDSTATNFYPIGNFIRSQLQYLDSVPLAIIRYSTANQISDTSVIEKAVFGSLATALITPDISAPALKAAYVETSFIDATLGTISLTYTANSDETPIKRADVLLNQENGAVKTIYIEKNLSRQDSVIVQKILWTANRNCQITTLTQKANQPERIVVDRYVWDDRE